MYRVYGVRVSTFAVHSISFTIAECHGVSELQYIQLNKYCEQ